MRRPLFRPAAVIGCVVWFTRALACDPSTAAAVPKDSDNDGLSDADERAIHGTSPAIADTDGDGFSDYDEIITKVFEPQSAPLRFNPLVADVPMVEIELASIPWLTLHLTDINGETRTFEVDRTFRTSVGESVSVTDTVSEAVERRTSETINRLDEVSRQVSLQVELKGDAGTKEEEDARRPAPPTEPAEPVMATLTNAVRNVLGRAVTVDASRATEVSFSFTATQTREFSQAVTYAEAYSKNHEVQASGGSLEVLAFIRNRSNLTFQVTNLFLVASVVTGDGDERPLGNLEISSALSSFQAFSMSPGQELGPITFFSIDLTLEQAVLALRDVRTIRIRIGAYELKDGKSRPYTFDVPTIRSRTAAVSLDYGGLHPREWYMVATNLDPARAGVSLYRAMAEILRIPLECDPASGRVSVRGVGAEGGDRGRWCIFHRYRDEGEERTIPYCSDSPSFDCKQIELRAGDLVRVAWIAD